MEAVFITLLRSSTAPGNFNTLQNFPWKKKENTVPLSILFHKPPGQHLVSMCNPLNTTMRQLSNKTLLFLINILFLCVIYIHVFRGHISE